MESLVHREDMPQEGGVNPIDNIGTINVTVVMIQLHEEEIEMTTTLEVSQRGGDSLVSTTEMDGEEEGREGGHVDQVATLIRFLMRKMAL